MFLTTEDWIDETGAGGRMLRSAERQAVRAFVTAHAACRVADVPQLSDHLTILDSSVAVWWTCASCRTQSPVIEVEASVWQQILTALRPH